MKPKIELTIHYGPYGDQKKTVIVPVSDGLMQELMGKIELSDDPFSLMLASPGMYGLKGDAITARRKTFQMRREFAEEIANAMVPELMKAFGVHDELDGYRVSDMSPQEREYHQYRGRLPDYTTEKA